MFIQVCSSLPGSGGQLAGSYRYMSDWLAFHLKLGSGIDYFFKLYGLM